MTTGSSTQQASEGTRDVNIQDRVSEVNGNDDTHGRYIRLKKDEPLPSSVETKIIGAKSMLGEVADKLYVIVIPVRFVRCVRALLLLVVFVLSDNDCSL